MANKIGLSYEHGVVSVGGKGGGCHRRRAILLDELENTKTAAPIARADVRLDCYYRGDHMFNHLWDMVDAKIGLLEQEIEEFLPSVAARCMIDVTEKAR